MCPAHPEPLSCHGATTLTSGVMSHPLLIGLCPTGLVKSLAFSLAVLFYVILKESAWQSLSDKQNGEGLVQLFVFIVVVGHHTQQCSATVWLWPG